MFAGRPLGSLSYSEPNMSTTHGDIVAQLQYYFDGQRPGAGSSAIMRKVFHPTALLRGPVYTPANVHPLPATATATATTPFLSLCARTRVAYVLLGAGDGV